MTSAPDAGLLRIEDCLDAEGNIRVPPGVNFVSLIERNIAAVGDSVAYRYLDHTGDGVRVSELTWAELGVRTAAIAARVQALAAAGDRVAVLAPQGLDYIAGFFGAIKAGAVAVPLFAPELPGHAERLDTALRDSRPSVVLTTAAVARTVQEFLNSLPLDALGGRPPAVLLVDEIPDADAAAFVPVAIDVDGVSHLQYTGGATRLPVGVEVTHLAVGTNLVQMILSIDLLDRNTHGVSWLPLYHDMGLSMIGFPAVYGGHSTLMSPTAFIRRPLRWIEALATESADGRAVTAAPNFAYEWTAARGRPAAGAAIDLSNVVMIIGSEPVSFAAIETFQTAFAPFALSDTAFKPSYGLAEATLFVATIAPDARPRVEHLDHGELTTGRAVLVPADHPRAVPQVPCGQIARNLRCAVVDTVDGAELPDGRVGELWLQGDNVGRGYWNRPEETETTFRARLTATQPAGSHAGDGGGFWLRTGDLGFRLDGDLFVVGRMADVIPAAGGLGHQPQHLEATAADASPVVRRGYAAAFTVDEADGPGQLVIVAERAAGTARADTAAALPDIRAAIRREHGLFVADVRIVAAGSLPRTTSGKLARRACRSGYLAGDFG